MPICDGAVLPLIIFFFFFVLFCFVLFCFFFFLFCFCFCVCALSERALWSAPICLAAASTCSASTWCSTSTCPGTPTRTCTAWRVLAALAPRVWPFRSSAGGCYGCLLFVVLLCCCSLLFLSVCLFAWLFFPARTTRRCSTTCRSASPCRFRRCLT